MFQRQLLVFFSFPLFLCFACSKTNDATITTNIQAKMFADPLLKTASIAVSAKDGIVTLSGQVPSDAARAAARNIASQTPGVRQVIDSTSTAPATPLRRTPPLRTSRLLRLSASRRAKNGHRRKSLQRNHQLQLPPLPQGIPPRRRPQLLQLLRPRPLLLHLRHPLRNPSRSPFLKARSSRSAPLMRLTLPQAPPAKRSAVHSTRPSSSVTRSSSPRAST